MELPIQESSPASEMIDSLGSRANSSTGIVVPVMRLCTGDLGGKYTILDIPRCGRCRPQCHIIVPTHGSEPRHETWSLRDTFLHWRRWNGRGLSRARRAS